MLVAGSLCSKTNLNVVVRNAEIQIRNHQLERSNAGRRSSVRAGVVMKLDAQWLKREIGSFTLSTSIKVNQVERSFRSFMITRIRLFEQQVTYAWILLTCDACERSSSVDSAAESVGRESLVLTIREAGTIRGRAASFGLLVDFDDVVQAHFDVVSHFKLFLIEFLWD